MKRPGYLSQGVTAVRDADGCRSQTRQVTLMEYLLVSVRCEIHGDTLYAEGLRCKGCIQTDDS